MHLELSPYNHFLVVCLYGAKEAGIIYGTGVWQIGEIKAAPAYEEAYKMGISI